MQRSREQCGLHVTRPAQLRQWNRRDDALAVVASADAGEKLVTFRVRGTLPHRNRHSGPAAIVANWTLPKDLGTVFAPTLFRQQMRRTTARALLRNRADVPEHEGCSEREDMLCRDLRGLRIMPSCRLSMREPVCKYPGISKQRFEEMAAFLLACPR